jgi:Transposase DDE domain
MMRLLAKEIDAWADDAWLVDSTPVECGRSRPTAKRSNLAGRAGNGYCASHSRYYWGLRLHLLATPAGLPVAFALANPKTDERDVALDLFDSDPELFAGRAGQTLVADKGYTSAEFETRLAAQGIDVVRPAMKRGKPRRGARQLRSIRQIIESVNDTLKRAQPRAATAAIVPTASPPASSNASSPSPPRSGTTTTTANPYSAPSPPATTDSLDFPI